MRTVITHMCADYGIVVDVRKESNGGVLYAQGRSAGLYCDQIRIGAIGEVSLKTRDVLGIDDPVFACEMDMDVLSHYASVPVRYRSPSAFPSVWRDITFVVDESHSYGDMVNMLANAHVLIASVEPRDVYRDERIGSGKKSLSFHVGYQLHDRTLTSQEVDEAHGVVVDMVKEKWNATVR